jgi:hypothetical protein
MAQHILIVGIDGGEWADSLICLFTHEERGHCTDSFGDRVGPQSRPGCYGEKKNVFHLAGIEPQFPGDLAHT